jgi:hypothetical protein
MTPIPTDISLYNTTKKYIRNKYPISSAYRSGLLVKEYKRRYTEKYGNKSPYLNKKTRKSGLNRWFSEKWLNSRGEIGYQYKNDIYRPSFRITKKTPLTYKELSKNRIKQARRTKYRKGRVNQF